MPTLASSDPLLPPGFLSALDRLSLQTRRPRRGQFLGARRSLRHGASVEFSDYRDYAAGDDLRTIDWKAYGRLDKLLVKLFQEEDDLALHLLMDASLSMTFGGKLQFAKQLCAALGAVALMQFDRCSLNVLSGGAVNKMESRTLRGRSFLPQLLARLAQVSPSGQARVTQSLSAILQRRASPGVLVLLSDFYEHGLTTALLARASRTHDVVLVHVIAPEEINPEIMLNTSGQTDPSSDVRFIDSETGESLELTLTPQAISDYHAEFSRFCDGLETIARAAGAAYTRVVSNIHVEEVVLGALRAERVVA